MKNILQASILFFSVSAFSQNLVINPGFEDTLLCPNFVSQIDYATNWHTSVNTPDYYHACNNTSAINPGMVGVPYSARGFQHARTGDAFAGAVIYWTQQPDYRELFYAQLGAPLIAGIMYDVGMYVVMNEDNAQWAMDGGLGIYLSSSPINPANPFVYTPQIVNPSGNVLNDTLNWTAISGEYIAMGGEQYITIGSFIRDTALTIINRGGTYPFTSYAIDDVWVTSDTGTSADESGIYSDLGISYNSTSKMLQLEFSSEEFAEVKIQIMNMLGVIISEKNGFVRTGGHLKQEIFLPVNTGVYIVSLLLNDVMITKKFIIQN